jgi:hypothetical protein
MKLYPRRTATHALAFLDHVLEEMPFPIQHLQTDRGTEFTAYNFRDDLAAEQATQTPPEWQGGTSPAHRPPGILRYRRSIVAYRRAE